MLKRFRFRKIEDVADDIEDFADDITSDISFLEEIDDVIDIDGDNNLHKRNQALAVKIEDLDFQTSRSLLRLAVGGVLDGSELLMKRLKILELRRANSMSVTTSFPDPTAESDALRMRYALIGLLFEGHDKAKAASSSLSKAGNASSRYVMKRLKPFSFITHNRFTRPAYNGFEQLVTSGESTVERWIERGREEDDHSDMIAAGTFHDTLDDFIDLLAQNQEIKDLVQEQSAGLASEILDETREKMVTFDTLLERMARGILRRPPREALPPPDEDIRELAEHMALLKREYEVAKKQYMDTDA